MYCKAEVDHAGGNATYRERHNHISGAGLECNMSINWGYITLSHLVACKDLGIER